MKSPNTSILALAAAAILAAAQANAAVIFALSAGEPAYTAAPGAPVNIPIYLTETLTNNSAPQLAADDGLFGYGFSVQRTGPATSAAAITAAASNSTIFDSKVTSTLAPDSVGLSYYQDDVNAPHATPDAQGRVLLATLTLTAPTDPGLTTTFTLTDLPGTDDNITYAFNVLDPNLAPATFSITSLVPEPSVLLLAPATLALRRRRSRR